MRSLNAVLSLGFLLVTWGLASPQVHADITCKQVYDNCIKAGGQPDNCLRAKSVFSKEALKTSDGSKCDDDQKYTAPQLASDPTSAKQQVDAFLQSGEGYESADLCCKSSSGDDCAKSLTDAQSLTAVNNSTHTVKQAAGTKPSASIKGSATTSSEVSSTSADIASSAVGACAARADVCQDTLSAWKSQVGKIPGSDRPDWDATLSELNDNETNCGKLKLDETVAQYNKLMGQKAGSDTTAGDATGQGTQPTSVTDNSGNQNPTASGSSSGVNPQSLMGLISALAAAQQDPSDDAQQPVTDCSNPAIAGCQQPTSNSWNNGVSQASIKPASLQPGGNSNPAPTTSDIPQSINPATGNSDNNNAAMGTGVPNGGGAMPSMSGGATLGGVAPGGQVPGGAASLASKMTFGDPHGGSGYSSINQAMKTDPSTGGGGFTGYGRGGGSDVNQDLAQLFPKTVARGLAGANLHPETAQINTPGVNIWSRISDHIKARCSQGLLRDCIP